MVRWQDVRIRCSKLGGLVHARVPASTISNDFIDALVLYLRYHICATKARLSMVEKWKVGKGVSNSLVCGGKQICRESSC